MGARDTQVTGKRLDRRSVGKALNLVILLDTSILVLYPQTPLPSGELMFSSISYAELNFGIANQRDPRVRAARQFRVSMLERLGVEWLPFDQHAALGYAHVAAHVHKRRPRHSRSKDIMLAGQAYALGAALATTNAKDFDLVTDLVEIISAD